MIYYLLLILGLLLPNIALCFSPYVAPMAATAGILLPMGVYLCLLALGKRPGRTLLLFLPLLLIINAVQLVLFTIFEGEVIAVDMLLNLFSASGDEAGELLVGLLLPISIVLALYIGIVVIAVRSWRGEPLTRPQQLKGYKWGCIAFLIGLLTLWRAHYEAPDYSLRASVYPVNVFYNMYVAGGKLKEVLNYSQTSQDFSYQARSARPDSLPEVYVFVLGETSRAYSWQLYGYERETNPKLSARAHQLVVMQDLTTQSNTTFKSAPILLSPADAEHSERLPQVKGILTAMKEGGFHTVFITNQPANRSFVDFFAYEADEHYRIRDLIRSKRGLMDTTPIYDGDMLPYLDQALKAGHRKLFVVLHAYGSHWSYRDRYPKEASYFTPDDALGANALERPKLLNAYDNAIRYTDNLLEQVITRLEQLPAQTAMYYTADHGEDVFDDDRERILHSSISVSYYQLHVPAVLWLSESYRSRYPEILQSAQRNAPLAASSCSNMHTLLDLVGVTTPELRPELSLLSPSYTAPEIRKYLNDRYECVPLSEMITKPQDLEIWRKMRLRMQDVVSQ